MTETVQYNATATIKSSENPATLGDSITYTATIAPKSPAVDSPTGTATFYIDGKAVQTVSLPGSITGPVTVQYTTSSLTVAKHNVYVIYNGDGNFGTATSATLSQTVQAIANRITATVSPTGGVGTNLPFSVSVVAYNAQNQVATKYTNQPVTITYTYTSASSGGTIGGTLTGTMKNGKITLSGLYATKVGSYVLHVFAGNLEVDVTITTAGRRS